MANTLIERLHYAAEWPPDEESRSLFREAAAALAPRDVPRAEPVAWQYPMGERMPMIHWGPLMPAYPLDGLSWQPLYAAPPERSAAQRDDDARLLATAIRDAAVKAGIVRPDASLTGPQLIMLCDELARADALRAALRALQITAIEYRDEDGYVHVAEHECRQCWTRWKPEEPERHSPGCLLAAMQEGRNG